MQGAVPAQQEVADDGHRLAEWWQRTSQSGSQASHHCETSHHGTTAKFSTLVIIQLYMSTTFVKNHTITGKFAISCAFT